MSRYTFIVCIALVYFAAVTASAAFTDEKPELKYHWNQVNFTWRTKEEYDDWVKNDGPHNCMPAGIKVSHSHEMFVSFPRWNPHVPATLTRIVEDSDGNAVFEPYPSWEMNEEGNVTALQSVLGFEIDADDRLWILDQGRVNNQQALPGSIKLVVWDIPTNTLVWSSAFAPEVAPLNTSFLNDLVIDVRRQKVYVTDSGLPLDASVDNNTYGALIVFDVESKTSRRVLSLQESTIANSSLWIVINDHHVNPDAPMRTGADGIALTADGSTLYYLPLTSHALYSLPVQRLVEPNITDEDLLKYVTIVTPDRGSASDGLACDFNNTLYLSSLEGNGILRMSMEDETPVFNQLTENASAMRWPDTLGFDHSGNIVYMANSLYLFVAHTINWTDPFNFCVWSYKTNTGSYLDEPEEESSSSGSKGKPLMFYIIIIGLSVFVAIGIIAIIIISFWGLRICCFKPPASSYTSVCY